MHIRDIEVEYRFKQLTGELDTDMFHRMIHLTRYRDNPDSGTQSHTDIHDYLESMSNPDEDHEAALFIVEQKVMGRVVGLAGVHIDTQGDERNAKLTEFMVNPEAHRAAQLGKRLVEQVVEWGHDHGADQVIFDTSEVPDNRATQLVPALQTEIAGSERPDLVVV